LDVVLDASVVVKWFVDEPDSVLAERAFDLDGIHILPGHALGEIGHVLIERYRRQEMTQRQFDLARSTLPGNFLIVPLDEIFDRAVDIALAIKQTLYDALYIATAERYETFVLTADRKLVRSVDRTSWMKHVVGLEDWRPASPAE
jgi:predicted nucleic acid-binding protein